MRIVIFGASGMLGQELCRAFSDCEILAPSEETLDLKQKGQLRDYLLRARPDLVLNAAAYNLVDQAETPAGYFRAMTLNGFGVGAMACAAALVGAPIIHYSTDYVFAREERGGFQEADEPGPAERLSVYGRSKLLGEKLLREGTRQSYLIRTSRLFGRVGRALGAKKSIVDFFFGEARRELFLSAVDAEVASPSYARDVALATRELWDERAPWGVYHLVNEGAATWYQLAKAVVALSGQGAIVRPVNAGTFPRAALRPRFSVLLNTRRPKLRPWQEALGEYLSQSKK